jgi:hypothetical protein
MPTTTTTDRTGKGCMTADSMPGLDALTDGDRKWFLAHPSRRYGLRPTAVAELLPGEGMRPGECTVVIKCGSPVTRMRLRVGRPPLHLRQDTDRCCRELIGRVDAAGYTLGGKRLLAALAELRRHLEGALA